MKYKDSGDRDFDLEARESKIRAEADAAVLIEEIKIAAYKLGFRLSHLGVAAFCGDNEITLSPMKFLRTHSSGQEMPAAKKG